MWTSVNAEIADVAGFLFNPNDVVRVSSKSVSWASIFWRAFRALMAKYWIINSVLVVLQYSNP